MANVLLGLENGDWLAVATNGVGGNDDEEKRVVVGTGDAEDGVVEKKKGVVLDTGDAGEP